MNIEPAFTIFIDESGSPVFQKTTERVGAYVVSAVCLPEIQRDDALNIIPKNPKGDFLKFSDRQLKSSELLGFMRRLFQLDVIVSIVMVRTDNPGNIKHAIALTDMANRNRKQRHNPKIKTAGLFYMLCSNIALINAWDRSGRAKGEDLSFFNLIYDNAPLGKSEKQLIMESLPITFRKVQSKFNRISWKSEQEEPLLNLPDLIAGTCVRQAVRGDVHEVWEVLETAEKRGTVFIQDGIDTVDPFTE